MSSVGVFPLLSGAIRPKCGQPSWADSLLAKSSQSVQHRPWSGLNPFVGLLACTDVRVRWCQVWVSVDWRPVRSRLYPISPANATSSPPMIARTPAQKSRYPNRLPATTDTPIPTSIRQPTSHGRPRKPASTVFMLCPCRPRRCPASRASSHPAWPKYADHLIRRELHVHPSLVTFSLTCSNATQRCGVGGGVERRCAAKMRPAWSTSQARSVGGWCQAEIDSTISLEDRWVTRSRPADIRPGVPPASRTVVDRRCPLAVVASGPSVARDRLLRRSRVGTPPQGLP